MRIRLFSSHLHSHAAPFLFSKSGVVFVNVASVPNGLIETFIFDAFSAKSVRRMILGHALSNVTIGFANDD